MKTLKIIIAVLCTICCPIFSKAQNQKEMLSECKTELKTCDYIFQGTVTQQYREGEWMWSIIEISKIYKGSEKIKLGSIKVVMQLGIEDGVRIIHKGRTYIFFNIPANPACQDTSLITTNNSMVFQCNDHIDINSTGVSWGVRKPLQFKSIDSLYSFFRTNGLSVPVSTK